MHFIATHLTTLMVVFLLGLGGCSNKEREEGRARFTEQAAEQIQAAKQKMNEYDFDAAQNMLNELREQIRASSDVDVATEDKLTADIDAAYAAISDKESDFHRKKLKGYILKDGKLLSPGEQKRILAEKARLAAQASAKAKAKRESDARERDIRLAQQVQREEADRRERKRKRELRPATFKRLLGAVSGGPVWLERGTIAYEANQASLEQGLKPAAVVASVDDKDNDDEVQGNKSKKRYLHIRLIYAGFDERIIERWADRDRARLMDSVHKRVVALLKSNDVADESVIKGILVSLGGRGRWKAYPIEH